MISQWRWLEYDVDSLLKEVWLSSTSDVRACKSANSTAERSLSGSLRAPSLQPPACGRCIIIPIIIAVIIISVWCWSRSFIIAVIIVIAGCRCWCIVILQKSASIRLSISIMYFCGKPDRRQRGSRASSKTHVRVVIIIILRCWGRATLQAILHGHSVKRIAHFMHLPLW